MEKKNLSRKIQIGINLIRKGLQISLKDFDRTFLNQYLPKKPTIINMMANDVCNSKCAMCNIWKQKKDFELTPEQLELILQDPLFSEIKYVGITGGEPTLREDLHEYYAAVCKSLPKLIGIGGITNAIKSDNVINCYSKVNEVAKQYGKEFGFMVSMDGYGEVHDKHRGRPGNFESALRVINYFRENTNINVIIGCTITKSNVWHIDELLDFLIEKKIYGRFRVGEYINRLYNENLTEEIRNFDSDEKYHLACFFQRLLINRSFEPNETHRRTYKSIIGMLSGESRTIGCPYHDEGVVLDSKGNIQYCAPKSRIIGNALQSSSLKIYKKNLEERRRILTEECASCIHDYHAPITTKEWVKEHLSNLWKRALSPKRSTMFSNIALPIKKIPNKKKKTVFITGWYGTETVGDKAILGAIINHYIELFKGDVDFFISSMIPFVTERTIAELKIIAKVVDSYSFTFLKTAALADITVMGGGPLMEIEALSIPLSAFRIAKKSKKRTVIFGCGIGPLKNHEHLEFVKEILTMADEIKLRDSASVEWGRRLTSRDDILLSGDPAYQYLIDTYKRNQTKKENYLACFLRDWSNEYQGELSLKEFNDIKEKFEENLARGIKSFCNEFNLEPRFYCMHTFPVGGDDREFYRRFTRKYFDGVKYYIEKRPSSVDQIVEAMQGASANLCMRFHSVVFAHTLNTNFVAIDYTQGGKIRGFLADKGELGRMYSLLEISRMQEFSFAKVITS